ncbi:sensor histidine kinase [Aeromicrobium alkaliterrae]|uniref:Sensor histidine kinase n=1 Tax=Aeromicrobium alkaliterrae TaxID=302168 RepID=A0ABP4W0S3_9ACTN
MTDDVAGSRSWDAIVRLGPLLLLAVAMTLVVVTRDSSVGGGGGSGSVVVCGAIALVVLVAHLWWVERRWGQPLDGRGGQVYWAGRTALGFVGSLFNPLFGLFATIGYFDSSAYLPRRFLVIAMAPVAVTMAGTQSGGLPPTSTDQLALFSALLVLNGGISMVLARVAVEDVDETDRRVAAMAELERTNEKLRLALEDNERLQAALLAQARDAGVHEERERLALEIHDTIAQGLIGIVTQLQAARDTGDLAAAADHRERAADLAREALGEARRSVQGLGPSGLDDADLDTAVREVVDRWSTVSGVRAELVVTGDPEPVSGDVAAAVLRVTQEALTNVARHAAASRVGVTIAFTPDEVVLDVRDDGAGFDPVQDHATEVGGFGLPGMRTRAARVSGELVVESEPGEGTAVSLRVPAVSRG